MPWMIWYGITFLKNSKTTTFDPFWACFWANRIFQYWQVRKVFRNKSKQIFLKRSKREWILKKIWSEFETNMKQIWNEFEVNLREIRTELVNYKRRKQIYHCSKCFKLKPLKKIELWNTIYDISLNWRNLTFWIIL